MSCIVVASRNRGKVREIADLLEPAGIFVKSLADFPELGEIPESGDTFRENALEKARRVSEALGLPVIADDSGLEVDVLGGEPGVRSARYAGPAASDEENNRKLLERLANVPPEKRSARFRCVAVYLAPGGRPVVSEGVCEGRLVDTPRGSGGFGYDPLFVPDGYDRTMAELDLPAKNRISHRSKAIRALIDDIAMATHSTCNNAPPELDKG